MKNGDIFPTKVCGDLVIENYQNSKKVLIKFLSTGYTKWTEAQYVNKGSIKDPYSTSRYNKGYFGIGKYNKKDNIKCYNCWSDMLHRCYADDSKYQTYKDCKVYEDWLNFQTFASWFYTNGGEVEGVELDKDILLKGNNLYCPDFCIFVPCEINCLFTNRKEHRGSLPVGVVLTHNSKYQSRLGGHVHDTPEEAFTEYRTLKKLRNKEAADKFLVRDSKIYLAVINYDIEITD